jgi:hypothetical protein
VQFVLDVVQDVFCALQFLLLLLVHALLHAFRALQTHIEVLEHDLVPFVSLGCEFPADQGIVAEGLYDDQH